MEDDKQSIAIGLGAGLGGFLGILIIGCICWQICCGSFCEKKTSPSTVKPVQVKQQRTTTSSRTDHTIINVKPIVNMNDEHDVVLSTSSDLATRMKATLQHDKY